MDSSGGIQASLGGRYAAALFELAREAKSIAAVEASLATLDQAMTDSDDLRRVVTSPVVARGAAAGAVNAVAAVLALDPLTTKFLGVLAHNRRLSQLPRIIPAFRTMAATHRGETTAQVTSAHPLGDDQLAALKVQLRGRVGRDVSLATKVDPAILGGIVVRIGSQMIDGSIRTKLNSLALAMRG